ncbi:MAG: hypothetical protein IJB38_02940 [Bacteroidales bacterium]|nr:hypothetical protein [Bacteroidales bacterium]
MKQVMIELPVGKLLVQNIILLLVPLAAGSLFRNLFPEAAVRVRKILGKMALPAICYALLMNVILLAYVYLIRRKQK